MATLTQRLARDSVWIGSTAELGRESVRVGSAVVLPQPLARDALSGLRVRCVSAPARVLARGGVRVRTVVLPHLLTRDPLRRVRIWHITALPQLLG